MFKRVRQHAEKRTHRPRADQGRSSEVHRGRENLEGHGGAVNLFTLMNHEAARQTADLLALPVGESLHSRSISSDALDYLRERCLAVSWIGASRSTQVQDTTTQ